MRELKELLTIYYRREKAVRLLIHSNGSTERRVILNERLSEISRAIYEIKKVITKNKLCKEK